MTATQQRAPRRERGVLESLLSIVLVLEAVLMFFGTITAFGLKSLPPAAAFIGGAVFIAVLVALSRLQRHQWAVWAGAAMQLAIAATGFILPIMFFIGFGFAALWVWCYLRARQVERHQVDEAIRAEAFAAASVREARAAAPQPAAEQRASADPESPASTAPPVAADPQPPADPEPPAPTDPQGEQQ